MELPPFKHFLGVTFPTCVASLFKMMEATGDDVDCQDSSCSDIRDGPECNAGVMNDQHQQTSCLYDGSDGPECNADAVDMNDQPTSCSYNGRDGPECNAVDMDDQQTSCSYDGRDSPECNADAVDMNDQPTSCLYDGRVGPECNAVDMNDQPASSSYNGSDGRECNAVDMNDQPASCSYDGRGGPAGNAYNIDDLHVIDLNSADEVRQNMAKAVMKSGNAQAFHYSGLDPSAASQATEQGIGMQTVLQKSKTPVQDATLGNSTKENKKNKLANQNQKSERSPPKERKQKSKFVNSFKRRTSIPKFYTGKLCNLMRDLAKKSRTG